jgi:acyl dehydratase
MSVITGLVTESAVTASAERVFELQRMPPLGVELLRAFASGARHPAVNAEPPHWQVRLVLARVEPKRLSAYRDVCGFVSEAQLPILYPQVLAAPLHMHLMTRRGFPFPLTGLVHVANSFEQTRALDAGESLGLSARIGMSRRTRHGTEFDVVTECIDAEGKVPWRATMTVLRRAAKRPEPSKYLQAEQPDIAHLSRYLVLDVPADIGRRYAHASLDFNPIHMSGPTARLLGFRRAIAHGMWSAARCAALLPMPAGSARRFEVRFRKPLFLPGRAVLRYADSNGGFDFAMLRDDGAVLVEGRLR